MKKTMMKTMQMRATEREQGLERNTKKKGREQQPLSEMRE